MAVRVEEVPSAAKSKTAVPSWALLLASIAIVTGLPLVPDAPIVSVVVYV